MANFNVTGVPFEITEGDDLVFTLTPISALATGLRVRWEIVLDGQLPASPSFFPALSGTVTFAIGATGGRTVTIATNDDLFISENRSFSVRLIEVAGNNTETQIGDNRAVTLIDDDTSRSFANIFIPATGEHDTLVFGSSYTYRSVSGAGGDDAFIITRHQRGDLSISDSLGGHIIKFDEGVEITHVDQNSLIGFGNVQVISAIALTLDTGAVITVPSPTTITGGIHRYRYQLGDGEVQIYADFYAELIAGGFEAGSTTELAIPYVITGGLNIQPNGGRDRFTVTSLQDTVEEGNDLSFTLTPVSALGAETTVRWEIVLDGKLPASPSFFPALSGTVTFQAGAPTGQTVTIATNDDLFISENRSFSVRLIEVAGGNTETQIGDNRAVTLIDDDTSRSFANIFIPATGEHDTLVFGSSYTYRSVSGAGGDDAFIITRHQRGDLSISDSLGGHIIKFDEGVEITHVDQNSLIGFGNVQVISAIALTLDTGAVITVPSPTTITGGMHRYRYQLGDGEAQIYADFHAELIAGGFEAGSTTQLATPYAITGGLPDTGPYYTRWVDQGEIVPMSDGTSRANPNDIAGFHIFAIGDDGIRDENDVFVASVPGYVDGRNLIILDDRVPNDQGVNFVQGNDVYLIEQGFDALNLTISDQFGVNIIAFGDNVEVKIADTFIARFIGEDRVSQVVLKVDPDTSNNSAVEDTVSISVLIPEDFLFYDTNDDRPVLEDFDTFFAEII